MMFIELENLTNATGTLLSRTKDETQVSEL